MTEHSFDLAAALVDQAIERLERRDYGITRILFHDFGNFPINANHSVHDTGHTVRMWAYDDSGLLAAAAATGPHVGGSPQGRIVNFRAGHLTFGALDGAPGETVYFARGIHRSYTLTATAGSSSWVIGIGGGHEPQHCLPSLDEALDYILGELEPAAV